MRVRAALGVVALAWVAGFPACQSDVPVRERIFFDTRSPTPPRASDCERCHQEIFREWEGSRHARAWSSPGFARATHDYRAEDCLGCHAPLPFEADDPIRLRSAHREEGVTCVSCHLSPDPEAAPLTMRGPVSRSSPIEIHPIIAEDPAFRSSELCGTCHVAALAEWRDSPWTEEEEKPTCQGCHMPEIHRTVESVHDDLPYSGLLVAMSQPEDLRRHSFGVPDEASEHIDLAVVLEMEAGERALQVRITNRMPHALPTGAYGRRALALLLEAGEDSQRKVLIDRPADAIAAGGTREFRFAISSQLAASLEQVTLARWEHGSDVWAPLISAEPTSHLP